MKLKFLFHQLSLVFSSVTDILMHNYIKKFIDCHLWL